MRLSSHGIAAVAAAIVLGLIGLLTNAPVIWALMAAVVAMLLLAAVWVAALPTAVGSQTLSPAAVEVGQPAASLVTVRNTGSRRTVPLAITNRIGSEVLHALADPPPPGGASTVRMPLPTGRRGLFQVGPIEVGATDPFGLASRTTHRSASLLLTVHPRIHAMGVLPTGLRRELEGVGSRPQEGGVVFHSLREYEPGDDLRLIHWRSVAKTGELVVRRNVVTTEPRLMIVLDTRASSYDDRDAFEGAVEIAASLTQAGCDSHYPLSFRTTGGLLAEASPGGDGRAEIMQLLAQVQPAASDPGLVSILSMAERTDGVSVGLVTGRPDATATEGITRARSRFDAITVLQVGTSHRPLPIDGAITLFGPTGEEVAAQWRRRFG